MARLLSTSNGSPRFPSSLPHPFHLVLHLHHLDSLLWWTHHLCLLAAHQIYSTHLNLVYLTHHADPSHLRTPMMQMLRLLLQHMLFLRKFLLILLQNHL